MIGGTKGKVCTDAAFLSRHEDVLASHGYKKQCKPKRAFDSSYGGGGSKNGDKEEGRRSYKEKILPKKKNLLGPKESHGHVIIVDLNIISLEIVIKGRKRQKLWKMGPKVKLKMDSVGLQFQRKSRRILKNLILQMCPQL